MAVRIVMNCELSNILNKDAVIRFARREIEKTVGVGNGARFFFAGGVFKTLLTNKPPRDIDIWGASPGDRAMLVCALMSRGARKVRVSSFADTYQIAGKMVDIPRKTKYSTLEERLGRFDIALSAIGVEHHSDGGGLRAIIHPRALVSVREEKVLLLKPIVNKIYLLTTLERARRYARELGFEFPLEEESEIWRIYDAQSRTMQDEMLARYARTGFGGFNVKEEALCRRR